MIETPFNALNIQSAPYAHSCLAWFAIFHSFFQQNVCIYKLHIVHCIYTMEKIWYKGFHWVWTVNEALNVAFSSKITWKKHTNQMYTWMSHVLFNFIPFSDFLLLLLLLRTNQRQWMMVSIFCACCTFKDTNV